jgi:hypothetical protein
MKTLKTFLAEAPKLQPLDWKSAFEMCLIFSIDKVGRESYSDLFQMRKAWGNQVDWIYNEWGEGFNDEENSDWDDAREQYDSFAEYWSEEGEVEMDNLETLVKFDINVNSLKLPAKMWYDKNKNSAIADGEGDDGEGWPWIPGDGFNNWFPYFIGMDDATWTNSNGFNQDQLKVKGKGEEFLREVTKKMNTDWKMIKQDTMVTEVASIMVEGPLKITPQSQISKLMLNPTKFGINGIDKAEWGKFVKKPFTYDRPWMIGLEKQFKKYIG